MNCRRVSSWKARRGFPSIILLCIVIIVLGSCTRTVYVPVIQPAPVDVGSHIRTVAVVDRSAPEITEDRDTESVLNRARPELNREAAQRAINGLVRTMESSNRYDIILTAERMTTSATRGNWPTPLSWKEIESLAAKYDSDAVLVLESFDSQFIPTDGATAAPADGRGEILGRRFMVGGIAGTKLGFRLYDPQYQAIADEYMFDHKFRWEAEGNAIQMVVGGIIDYRQAVNEAGLQSGIIYAERISPRWLRLNREFFTKGRGNRDFKIGVRCATVNDWEGARQAWHESVNSPRRKVAGRSAFNLALMYEILGELDVAREWAQHSYTDYGIRKARSYVLELESRIREQTIAEEQFR